MTQPGLTLTEVRMAEWLGRWTCNLVVLDSSPPPYHSLDLFSVTPVSTTQLCCVNKPTVLSPASWDFKHFMFIWNICFSLFSGPEFKLLSPSVIVIAIKVYFFFKFWPLEPKSSTLTIRLLCLTLSGIHFPIFLPMYSIKIIY